MNCWIRKNHGKLNTILFVFVFFFILVSVGDVFAQKLAVNVPVANVRSGPGTTFEVLWQVEKYTPMLVMDKDKSGAWCYIKDFEGTIGWINRDVMENIDTVITKPRDERCNIRSGPNTNSDVIFKAVKGVPFKVLERKGDWIHIQHADGEDGWIHRMLVW